MPVALLFSVLVACATEPPVPAHAEHEDARDDRPAREQLPFAPPFDSSFSRPRGWCAAAHAVFPGWRTSLEVDLRTGRVRPLRFGGTPHETWGWSRHDVAPELGQPHSLATLEAHGEIVLWRPEELCPTPSAGCFDADGQDRQVIAPAEVVLRESGPVEGCIRFFEATSSGWVLGLEDEIRTYEEGPDGTPRARARLRSPALWPIGFLDDALLLVGDPPVGPSIPPEASTLWRLHWRSSREEPELASFDVGVRVVGIFDVQLDGEVIAFTERGIASLDRRTFAPSWHYDGDVRSVFVSDPHRLAALVVEPYERGSRVRLVMLDAHGRELGSHIVYEGDAIVDARLGRYDARTMLVDLEHRF